MPLAELEALRKAMLLTSRSLFALAGFLFLLSLGGREWGFNLGLFVAFIAWFLTMALRAGITVSLASILAKDMGLRLSPKGEFFLEGVLVSRPFPSPDGYEAKDLVGGGVSSAPSAPSGTGPYGEVEATSNAVSIYQNVFFFIAARYRFCLPFSVKGIVRFGPRGRVSKSADSPSLRLEIIAMVIGFLLTNLLIFWGTFQIWEALFWYASWAFFIYMFYTTNLKGNKGLERVVLESPEFERLYDVYGDQVEARKLFTPKMQEALVRLRKYLGRPVWGSAEGRNLWLRFGEKGRFPVSVHRPVSETFETWKAHYWEELLEIFRVAEILELEEEAKRKGVWRRKIFVGLSELSSDPKKDTALDGGEPQQTGDAPTRGHSTLYDKLFGNRK